MNKTMSNNIIHGLIQVVIPCFWLYQNISPFMRYQNPDINFFMRYPDWVMIIKIILGVTAVAVGIGVILKKLPVKLGYILSLGMVIFGTLFYEIIVFFISITQ